jgi:hypothetical protein
MFPQLLCTSFTFRPSTILAPSTSNIKSVVSAKLKAEVKKLFEVGTSIEPSKKLRDAIEARQSKPLSCRFGETSTLYLDVVYEDKEIQLPPGKSLSERFGLLKTAIEGVPEKEFVLIKQNPNPVEQNLNPEEQNPNHEEQKPKPEENHDKVDAAPQTCSEGVMELDLNHNEVPVDLPGEKAETEEDSERPQYCEAHSLNWKPGLATIEEDTENAEVECQKKASDEENVISVRKIMVSLPLLDEILIREKEIAQQRQEGKEPKPLPELPDASEEEKTESTVTAQEALRLSMKPCCVSLTRLSRKEIRKWTSKRVVRIVDSRYADHMNILQQQLQEGLKSVSAPASQPKGPLKKIPKKKTVVSSAVMKPKGKADEEIKTGKAKKERKVVVDFPASQPTTFDILGSILDAVKEKEKDEKQAAMQVKPPAPCPAPKEKPPVPCPAPVTKEKPPVPCPAPVTKEKPPMPCPAPVTKEKPPMPCPAPIRKEKPPMPCPAPVSTKSIDAASVKVIWRTAKEETLVHQHAASVEHTDQSNAVLQKRDPERQPTREEVVIAAPEPVTFAVRRLPAPKPKPRNIAPTASKRSEPRPRTVKLDEAVQAPSQSKPTFHGRTLLFGMDVEPRHIPKTALYRKHPVKPSGQKEVVPVDPRLSRKHYGERRVKLRRCPLQDWMTEENLSAAEKLK